MRIIEFLRDEERCVCEIVPFLELPRPVVSRHLKILRSCGILKMRKDGTKRLYSLTDPAILKIIDDADSKLIRSLLKRVINQMVYF